MAGRKLFTNHSAVDLSITLLVRASAGPRDQGERRDLALGAGESRWQEYGNDVDVYLDGLELRATARGELIAEQRVLAQRGSRLDDDLNRRNAIDISFDGRGFTISSRQA